MLDRHDIVFGTDGWRAVIGESFTLDNLERVALATAAWVRETYGVEHPVVLGHDSRFGGRMFTAHVARVLASEGIPVVVGRGITATPVVSWAVQDRGASAGIVITASHNPPQYSGFKIKGHFGGSALPSMVADVQRRIGPWEERTFDVPAGGIQEADLTAGYYEHVRARIDVDAIRQAGIRIVHDAMHGAGMGMYTALLGKKHVIDVRSDVNPSFGGIAPEPIERNLASLPETVREHGCDAAIANDGDADRIGMFDEKGHYVDSHRILALLVSYLAEDRGLKGTVVKTCSTTDMLDVMARELDLPLVTTPIGFKYIGEKILEGDVLVGGEESGGMAVKGHIPERDGIFIGLLVLEMMARRGKPLSRLVEELYLRFGPHAYARTDAHTTPARKEALLEQLRTGGGLSEVAGQKVTSVSDLDGYKHRTAWGWLLIRPSGTEPVLRIYAEARTEEEARAMVADATRQAGV